MSDIASSASSAAVGNQVEGIERCPVGHLQREAADAPDRTVAQGPYVIADPLISVPAAQQDLSVTHKLCAVATARRSCAFFLR